MPSASSHPISPGSGGGMSGGVLLAGYVTVMVALIAAFFFLRKKFQAEEKQKPAGGAAQRAAAAAARPAAAAAAAAAPAGRRGGRPARGALERMRRDLEQRNGGAGAEEEEDEQFAAAPDRGDDVDAGAPLDRAALREREKAASQAARQQVREQQEAAEAAKRSKGDKYAEKQRAREAEREAAEMELARAEKERAEKQAAADAAELEQWAGSFEVSGSGTAAVDESAETQSLLDEFVQYIISHKVVQLDEVAARFKIKTPDVILRIQTLESSGRLLGVFDDRGKYLYLTEGELNQLANWIQKKGRCTIGDIVAQANKIIDLSATQDETAGEKLILDEEDEKAA